MCTKVFLWTGDKQFHFKGVNPSVIMSVVQAHRGQKGIPVQDLFTVKVSD